MIETEIEVLEVNNIDVLFILKPHLNNLRPYLFAGLTKKEFNRQVRKAKKGLVIHYDFMDMGEGRTFIGNLSKILSNYPLNGHEVNLACILLQVYKQSYIKATRYRIPNLENPKKGKRFQRANQFSIKEQI